MFWYSINPDDQAFLFYECEFNDGDDVNKVISDVALKLVCTLGLDKLPDVMERMITAASKNQWTLKEQAAKWLDHPSSLARHACAETVENIKVQDGCCTGYIPMPDYMADILMHKLTNIHKNANNSSKVDEVEFESEDGYRVSFFGELNTSFHL